MIGTSRIVSLFDVLRVYAEGFVSIGNYLAHVSALLKFQQSLNASQVSAATGYVATLRRRAEELGLSMAALQFAAVEERLRDYEPADHLELQRLIDDAIARLHDEFSLRQVYMLDPSVAQWYSATSPFGDTVTTAFPSAADDIVEAGKCFALNRNTACVFHCMRATEVALKALASALEIPYAPSWDSYLVQIQKLIGRDWKDKEPEWKKKEAFYSGAAGDIVAVKHAWRNPTMHVRITHDAESAKAIFDATGGLMRHLATELHE